MTRKEYEDSLYREVFAGMRPTGQYQADAFVPVSDSSWMLMKKAERNDLIRWALHESDEANLSYIRSRLDLWNMHPECSSLAELEAAISTK